VSVTRLSSYLILFLFSISGLSWLSGCAANPNLLSSSSLNTSTSPIIQQNTQAATITRALVHFNYGDFYSLTAPYPTTSCAGDAHSFYDPIVLTTSTDPTSGPLLYAASLADSTTTIRPGFIKNISVDMTDANANTPTNLAYSCSYGSGVSTPPASNCATFDFGEIGGISSTLGGTLLLFGGLTTVNYTGMQSSFTPIQSLALNCGPVKTPANLVAPTGYNSCTPSAYALGVNALPASVLNSSASASMAPGLTSASGPISMWENLIGNATHYSGPPGKIGAASAYDSLLQKFLLFGGSAPLPTPGSSSSATTPGPLSPNNVGSATYDNWIFNLQTQTWTQLTSNIAMNINLERIYDFTPSSGIQVQLPKSDRGRAVFGYASVPGMAVSQLSTNGLVGSAATNAPLDTTDRLISLGGQGNCTSGICQDAHRFNPTFGPEYIDMLNAKDSMNLPGTPFPAQWIDSYHSGILSNSIAVSQYIPNGFPTPASPPSAAATSINFGMTGLSNNHIGTTGQLGAGYLLTAGGFYGYSSTTFDINTESGTGSCTNLQHCGGMEIFLKWFRNDGTYSWSQTNETHASNFLSVTNQNDGVGYQQTPGRWSEIPSNTPTSDNTPWFGGSVLLRGINVTSASANEVVYFGGSDCKYFLTDSTRCTSATWPTVTNSGAYWVFGTDPASLYNPTLTNYPATQAMAGSNVPPYLPPTNAGMAAARGLDPSGNPIIVAWGGMTNTTVLDATNNIYYLYNNLGTPTWGYFSAPAASSPPEVANATLVYSHITHKFYLFGGYNTTAGTYATTWELTVSSIGSSATCGAATSASCSFNWRSLDSTAGQTCYPSCPPARRSHRMVEANYNNYNLATNPAAEPTCTNPDQPCSFLLFMEGGTPDGISVFADRWSFDPTANSGAGHWQLMSEFPPRTLAAMSNVDYSIPATGSVAHRAVVFGGETGLQSPPGIPSLTTQRYFVPPTLGDTWMYDYDTNSWNRVTLYGHRYDPAIAASFSFLTEQDARAGSLVTDASSRLLSPPPLSGAIMVTRTTSKANHLATDPPVPLAIPEIFLFGGRKKDGTYQTFDQVFKFCAGSTGEKPYPTSLKGTGVPLPDNATCDTYDPVANPNSPSPIKDYVGRWLLKNPGGTGMVPSTTGRFLGMGAYDSLHDLIGIYGGIQPTSLPTAVTDSSTWSLDAASTIIEYTPPSAVSLGASQLNGSFTAVGACTCFNNACPAPPGRYGHTFAYDTYNQGFLSVGGYDINGNLLTQTETYSDGSTYQVPQVWLANRVDTALSNAFSSVDSGSSTFPCYYWNQITLFGNSIYSATNAPLMTGIAHAASVYIPSSGYKTGYYTTYDNSCINAGPIANPDPSVSRLLAGGAYIDIDRSQLGVNENLILNLTFIPLGTSNIDPNQSYLATSETAIFKVHLIKTGQSGDTIRQVQQPRYLTYSMASQFPEVVQDLAVLAPPTGQVRQEQVYIPLTMDPGIDRIRIERYSGNAILIDASIYRLGQPSN